MLKKYAGFIFPIETLDSDRDLSPIYDAVEVDHAVKTKNALIKELIIALEDARQEVGDEEKFDGVIQRAEKEAVNETEQSKNIELVTRDRLIGEMEHFMSNYGGGWPADAEERGRLIKQAREVTDESYDTKK